MAYQSPLFGRMTGQWLLHPLRFGDLPAFLPDWSPDELVATYAIVGGVPAYLEWLISSPDEQPAARVGSLSKRRATLATAWT